MNTHQCKSCGHRNERDTSLCRKCGTPLDFSETQAAKGAASPKIRRNQVIARRYVVKDVVGRGGMGRIYKVYDNTLEETVALKTLHPEYVHDKMVLQRFFNEARIARGLSHPHIVRVHDIGSESQLVYISMELLEGKSLRKILDELPPGERLPIDTVLRIFDELCSALQYAHRFTIHRDLKPENVMVLPDGSVKLMDFGISKLMSNPNLTSASIVMGTPHYMSPEQLQNTSKVDARADVYSLGVMLYEVLTGQTPTGVPRRASELSSKVPPALDPIIEKCVQPNPDQRYLSAGELREALRSVRETLTSGVNRHEAAAESPARGPFSFPIKRFVGAALLVATAGVSLAGLQWAEARRATLSERATRIPPPTIDTVPAEPAAPEENVGQILALLEEMREPLGRFEADHPHDELPPLYRRVVDDILDWEQQAKTLGRTDPAGARQAAWNAVHNALALLTPWPEGTVFVPPGDQRIDGGRGNSATAGLGAFFIDRREVSVKAYAAFSQEHDWREVQASASTAPVVNVTYFDAQAFAATRQPPARLPTEAEWVRAVALAQEDDRLLSWAGGSPEPDDASEGADLESTEYFMFDMAGSQPLLEWTRTRYADLPYPDDASPTDDTLFTFGTPVVVRGGAFVNGTYVPMPRLAGRYEDKSVRAGTREYAQIGFRCVYKLPGDLEAARAVIAGVR